ncbi:uncharacterized protein LOC119723908 [Patiria miniata]|uniref:DED domain-containing protein n=1 Tax=Patiria miniata TaxID=46514 RepID=A0A913ZG24_PATMI|nr:uncharacterized protein LOC119723908 [Patiria miniata]
MAGSSSDATTVQMTGAAAVGEQPLDITDQRTINLFSELLSMLAKELTEHELTHARLLCSHQGVPAGELETDDAVEFLRVLEKHDLIGEDKTQFLKELLEKSDISAGIDFVKEYEEKRRTHIQNVEILLGKRDPFFVGRTTFVSRILEVFGNQGHDKCRCVLVYGLAGTGKTKLAVESSAIYKEQAGCGTRLLRVNLRKATNMEEVGLWILNTVTGKQITQKQFDMELVKKWIMNCLQDTVLLLDNADDILNPSSYSKDHFVNTLSDLLSITNCHVKFLLTSRHPVDFMGLKELPNFKEVKLEPLPVRKSLQLLTKMFNHAKGLSGMVSVGGEALQDEESLVEIAKLCGNNPQALRAVASRLSSGFSPRSLVEYLKCPEGAQRVLDPGSLGSSQAVQDERKDFEDQPLVLNSLGAMYEQLPLNLKESLLKLSVFPSSFSLSQGAKVVGKKPSDAVIKFDLEDLKKWSLLERDDDSILDTGLSDEEPYYFMHPLVRSVCLSKIGSSEIHKAAYEDALRRFLAYIADLLKDLTQLGHRDFASALARFESDKTNVLHYLELGMGNKFGCEVIAEQENPASDVPLPKTEGLFSIFETFLDPSKRLEYYTNMSIRMLSRGEQEAWAYLRGWMADELYVRAKYDEAWNAVEEPLKVLKARASDPAIGRTNDLERAEAQLLYVKGRILVARRKYKDGIAILEQALKIQERLLGNHSLTARCLNGLGHAYFNKADDDRLCIGATEAHEYHLKAWEMLVKITNGKPEKHFDAPMYLLNIGATFHQMGKKFKRSNKKNADEYFNLAIKNYHEAYDLERALKLSNSPNTAFVLKNMAMSYCEMEEYEKALPLATDAVNIREETIGVHPTTARNLFFIGSLYDSLGDECKKSKKPEDRTKPPENYKLALEYYNRAFEMEVKLGPSNHSIEYDDLKTDLQDVLRKLHMNKELDKYRRMFKAADKGTPDLGDLSMDLRSVSGQASPSRKRSPDRMDAEDGHTGTSDDDEMAGPSRQRAPGPVFPDENPSKRSKCSMS